MWVSTCIYYLSLHFHFVAIGLPLVTIPTANCFKEKGYKPFMAAQGDWELPCPLPGVLNPAGRVREGSPPASPAAGTALYRGFTEDQREAAGGAEEAGKDEQAPWRCWFWDRNVFVNHWGSWGLIATFCMARSFSLFICGILYGFVWGYAGTMFGGTYHIHNVNHWM